MTSQVARLYTDPESQYLRIPSLYNSILPKHELPVLRNSRALQRAFSSYTLSSRSGRFAAIYKPPVHSNMFEFCQTATCTLQKMTLRIYTHKRPKHLNVFRKMFQTAVPLRDTCCYAKRVEELHSCLAPACQMSTEI